MRRFWVSWEWGVYGAVSGAIIALAGFGLAQVSERVNDPLFDALAIMGPILVGAALAGNDGWPLTLAAIPALVLFAVAAVCGGDLPWPPYTRRAWSRASATACCH
jgi:hypothetical protein